MDRAVEGASGVRMARFYPAIGKALESDEEWVELGRKMADEESFQALAARFPAPTTV
jgi:hypothetical protein